MYARILHRRLSSAIEPYLHPTQYGFRQARGTSQAIHLVRRILEAGEGSTNKLILILLDWEKAFDKLAPASIPHTLRRFGVPDQLVAAIESIYLDPEFQVEIDGTASTWHRQQTGIRQGCPLSPVLLAPPLTQSKHFRELVPPFF